MSSFLTQIEACFDELTKLAFVAKTPQMKAKVKAEEHFEAGTKDWKTFEKNLKGKNFQNVVVKDARADDKLKRYTQAMGDYLTSKKVFAKVPSQATGKQYTVKEMSNGRLGCNCKDWQFKHSHAGGDCKHIDEVAALRKTSGAIGAVLNSALATNRVQKMQAKGLKAKQTTQAFHQALGR